MPLHKDRRRRRKPAAPCGDPAAPSVLDEAAERLGITLADAWRYGSAVKRWAKAGFPTRPQEEVVRILTELCEPCPEYIDGRCRKCRCQVNASAVPLVNKIKMATEHSPSGKW